MKRIIHNGLLGAYLGAAKGMADLYNVRHTNYSSGINPYIDKVEPPPTYAHAAADQGSVGLLGGLAIGGIALGAEKRRAPANPAGRRDRASSNTDFAHRPVAIGRRDRAATTNIA